MPADVEDATEVALTEHDEELIEEGQQLVQGMDSAQLRIGRLALEFAPMGERGLRSGAGLRVEMFADRVSLLPSTLKVYRATAHAWSPTNVKDGEFSFAVLQTLVSVGDKEGLLKKLRETPPPTGRQWTAADALAFAKEHSYMPTRNQGVDPDVRQAVASGATHTRERNVASGTWKPGSGGGNGPGDVPRETNLRYIGEQLRKSSFIGITEEERETLDPLLAKVEGEAARLRRELSGRK